MGEINPKETNTAKHTRRYVRRAESGLAFEARSPLGKLGLGGGSPGVRVCRSGCGVGLAAEEKDHDPACGVDAAQVADPV